ncbi:MAG: hypothetical protein AAF213_05050 [Pseudomonadota bacterium]
MIDQGKKQRDCDIGVMAEIALVGDTEPCICKPAVLRAYDGMKKSGAAEKTALDVAERVLTHHHPEMPHDRIKITVERWVHRGQMH